MLPTTLLLIVTTAAAPPWTVQKDSRAQTVVGRPTAEQSLVSSAWPLMPHVHLVSAVDESATLERLPAPESSSVDIAAPYTPYQFETIDTDEDTRLHGGFWADLWQDQLNYYSWQTLQPSLVMFGLGAVLANTQLDQQFRNDWQEDVHSDRLRSVALEVRNFGDGSYVIPAFLGMWLGGTILGDVPGASGVASWGAHTTRGILVGFPAMLVMQEVTGGSRPIEAAEVGHPSHWKFWQDNNGVSGHTFIGAIPFLTAAGLVNDPTAKAGLLIGSTLVGLSRIETDSHYLSQVILGWWMAYIATNAVQQTAFANAPYSVSPLMMTDGAGLAFTFRR